MTTSVAVAALRKRHIWLEALPDTVSIPALEARQRPAAVKAIQDATLDDIAFAMLGAEAEFNAVGDRLHALRKLYNMARQAGALGSDRAVDAISGGGC
ncbi:MAG: hypothetical protein BGN91_07910 [Nitrobacter sp. 62-13]|uniref:hypothetical protein n=1 Tax=Nitrobacter sp. 62-13 TaxID=1895797 RepID=UPI000964B359|nr:hypothetical protein [Nitrobacter sp. 62-13]OJU28507.1 MAG: hypothetical protein BGN91_07910 [Nitrobacter sp. 62-13]